MNFCDSAATLERNWRILRVSRNAGTSGRTAANELEEVFFHPVLQISASCRPRNLTAYRFRPPSASYTYDTRRRSGRPIGYNSSALTRDCPHESAPTPERLKQPRQHDSGQTEKRSWRRCLIRSHLQAAFDEEFVRFVLDLRRDAVIALEGVAQLGGAMRSGRRGRWFESSLRGV